MPRKTEQIVADLIASLDGSDDDPIKQEAADQLAHLAEMIERSLAAWERDHATLAANAWHSAQQTEVGHVSHELLKGRVQRETTFKLEGET